MIKGLKNKTYALYKGTLGSSSLPVFVFIALVFLNLNSQAKNSCDGIFNRISSESVDPHSKAAALQRRIELISKLVASHAVAYLRIHPDGSQIPVILVNKKTLTNPVVIKAINESISVGMNIGWDPNSPDIDHGFTRSGDRMVDYGKHGDRMTKDSMTGEVLYGSRELNETGLVHRSFEEYVNLFRNPNSPVMMELAYFATPAEIQISKAFHNMRRAGVVRNIMESIIRYEANMNPNQVNEWFLRHPRTMVGMEYTENCVSYCLGGQIARQIDFMKWKVGEIGYQVDNLMQRETISKMVNQAMKQLSQADWKDPKSLQPEMLSLPVYREVLDGVLPLNKLSQVQKNDLIAYLVAIEASAKYRAVVEVQGLQNAVGVDSNPFDHRPRAFYPRYPEMDSSNPQALAVFIYDDQPGDEDLFLNGTYEYRGRAHGIFRTENSESRNIQIPLPQIEKKEKKP